MKRNLIQSRIALVAEADMVQCPDVQAFIQAKVDREAYIKWCREDQEVKLIPDTLVYEKWSLAALFSLFKSCLP